MRIESPFLDDRATTSAVASARSNATSVASARSNATPPARLARAVRRALPALGLLLVAACLTAGAGKAVWVNDKVDAQSDRVLMEVTRIAMEKTGFPLAAGLDPQHLTARSGWMISLAPFRKKGFREQCEVRFKPVGSLEYEVEVRVKRELNDDLLRPLDLTYAEWIPDPDNAERARIVMQYIKSLLSDEPKPPSATAAGAEKPVR